MVVASRVRLRSPLTCPSGTFSPRAGRRASDLRWGDKLHGSNTLHASLLPACGEKVPNGRMSNCVACQAIFGSPTHGWPSRSMALRMVSNFRMHATNATFLALPAARKRWWKTRSVGLKRTALSVAM